MGAECAFSANNFTLVCHPRDLRLKSTLAPIHVSGGGGQSAVDLFTFAHLLVLSSSVIIFKTFIRFRSTPELNRSENDLTQSLTALGHCAIRHSLPQWRTTMRAP